MVMISDHPKIMLEFTSETERTLLFDTAVIDADIEHFRQMAGDMNAQTANSIIVHLEDLPYGRLRICWNPVPKSKVSLDWAVHTFSQYLREMCTTCPDFNPEHYAHLDESEAT